MAADVNMPVEITTRIPDGDPITATIGTVTVPVRDGTLHTADTARALGSLLIEAGTYMIEHGAPPAQQPED